MLTSKSKVSTMTHNNTPINLILLPTVCKKIRLGKSTIYSKINPKSKYYDPSFPKSVKISDSRIAWIEEEINEWIRGKIEQRSTTKEIISLKQNQGVQIKIDTQTPVHQQTENILNWESISLNK